MQDDAPFSFHCTACGKCCNSPPRLTLPELLHHQDVFIGCLAISRLAAGADAQRAALLDTLAFRAPGPGGATHIAIVPQGYGYDSAQSCPALAGAGLCALHEHRKPMQCGVVPLDPLAPDPQQGLVLSERLQDGAWLEAGCIGHAAAGARAPLIASMQVVDPVFASALQAQRGAMAADLRMWGRGVFDLLRADGTAIDSALSRVPLGGFVALPMVPALLVLAGISEILRQACITFLKAQVHLIDVSVRQSVLRRQRDDRPMTERLRAWAVSYRGLHAMLIEAPLPERPESDVVARAYLEGPLSPVLLPA